MDSQLLPSNYKALTLLGQGCFGAVLKCVKEDTKETVAVKIPRYGHCVHNELTLLNLFKRKNLDKWNIVRFVESFTLRDDRVALAFEMLDETLRDYLGKSNPLDLHEVRSVVQQMATALNALKTIEVIHADIKLDNIMLVHGEVGLLRVKLIDFGLAFPTCRAVQGKIHQAKLFRAPEIILGLPFSEAIDMWSLGVVMAFMVLGNVLFPGNAAYDIMRGIVKLLGVPPDHVLSAGRFSSYYFVKTSSGYWRLKTPEEFFQNFRQSDCRACDFCNLDDLETLPLRNLNVVEADEKKECIDLLKAMLRMDANERITPSQVLAHPFITRDAVHHSSDSGFHGSSSATLPPGVIMVRPAPAERCLRWDEDSGQQSGAWCFRPLDWLEDPRRAKSAPLPPPILPEDCNTEQEHTELTATTSDDTVPEKKKKKIGFKRFFSWTKGIFCSCISVVFSHQ